jgi:RNA polymerase sigma-70 factor, ECF subfamily
MADEDEKVSGLIREAVAGNKAALGDLMKCYSNPSLNYVKGQMSRLELGGFSPEDVVQETFEKVWISIKSFRPGHPAGFFEWLKRIAKRALINLLRAARAQKRGGGRERVERVGESSILKHLPAPGRNASSIVRRRHSLLAIQEALMKLPADDRELLGMHYLEGMKVREIAARLAENDSTIAMRISRAIVKLRAILEAMGDFSV